MSVIYSEQQDKKIKQVVQHSLLGTSTLPPAPARRVPGLTVLEGYLDSDLDEAEEEGEGVASTTAMLNVYRGKGDDFWKQNTIGGENEQIEIVNRSTQFSASEGDYIQAIQVNGEWRPLSAGGICKAYNYRLTILGEPSHGTFVLSFLWDNSEVGTDGREDITIQWNEEISSLETKLQNLDGCSDPEGEEANYAADNGVGASGDDFPHGSILFRVIAGLGGKLLEIVVSENNLTGGIRQRVRIEQSCCG